MTLCTENEIIKIFNSWNIYTELWKRRTWLWTYHSNLDSGFHVLENIPTVMFWRYGPGIPRILEIITGGLQCQLYFHNNTQMSFAFCKYHSVTSMWFPETTRYWWHHAMCACIFEFFSVLSFKCEHIKHQRVWKHTQKLILSNY